MGPTKTRFSIFGIGVGARGGDSSKTTDPAVAAPRLKLQTDKNVYRPGDPVMITMEIENPEKKCSLLVEKMSFEIKGIEKLDSQWFSTQKPDQPHQKRGYSFILTLIVINLFHLLLE